MFTSVDLSLRAAERGDLEHLVRATSTTAGIARRARCVLLLADGATYAAVCAALAVTDRFIARCKQRYVQGGILALPDAPRSGRQSHRLRPAWICGTANTERSLCVEGDLADSALI
ncbi:MAG: helix-turn-helix domain-containing protein [Gemmatimonadota bacterium]|nr:helix-turn-helix domain-containing protein [Gemmatimonadota bacterium]